MAASSRRLPNTAGYYGAFVAFGLTTAALGPALPGLAENARTSLSGISLLFTAQSLGYVLSVSLGGRVFDRFPGHPLMAGFLVVAATVVALIPGVPLLWLLALLTLILGAATGIVEVGGNTLLVWVHRRNLDPWMNGLHFCFGVGAFLSPLIITQVVEAMNGLSWAFWILAWIILLPAAWIVRLPSPPPPGSSRRGQDGAGINYALVLPMALLFLLYVGAEVGFGGWIFTYAVTLHPGMEPMAGYLTSAFWGALTLGRLLAIPLSARLSPAKVLAGDLVGAMLSVGLILVWPASMTAVWVGTLGTGLAMASIFPTLMNFADRRMEVSGRINGWLFGGAGLGGMFLPWMIGQLFESAGPHSTMVTIMADLGVAIGVFTGLVLLAQARPRFVEHHTAPTQLDDG